MDRVVDRVEQIEKNPHIDRGLTFNMTSPLQTSSNVPKVSKISFVFGLTWIFKAVVNKKEKVTSFTHVSQSR